MPEMPEDHAGRQAGEQGGASQGLQQRRPFVVALTGGPSSGKSSALALLRDRLSARGFQVLTVPENATHFLANSDGFQAEWVGTTSQVCMQRIFMDYQLEQESAFKAFAALHPTKPAVLLLDRCTIDSKVFLSDEQWNQALALPGKPVLTEEQLMERYDLVIHMVTCAFGAHYEWGPGSNNPGRYHTPCQAKEQDERCLQVFAAHPQLRVVPHCADFASKIGKVVEFVNDALHVEGLAGRRRRRTCTVANEAELIALIEQPSTSGSVVTTTFLDEGLQRSVRRAAKVPSQTWLQQFRSSSATWLADDSSSSMSSSLALGLPKGATELMYERRSEVRPPGGTAHSYLTRRVIGEEDFYTAVETAVEDASTATKLVLRFLDGHHYYELFFFSGQRELVLDFSADAGDPPSWVEFVGSRDASWQEMSAAAHASTGILSPSKLPPAEQCGAPTTKRRRVLKPHSTQEAAVFGG